MTFPVAEPAVGELALATKAEVYSVQVAATAALGALVGVAVRHPMAGAVVGAGLGVLALRTPVSLWVMLGLQKAGLLYTGGA